MRSNSRTFPAAEIVPQSQLAPLDLETIFARLAPLEVDLGCGDGTYLVALARQNPAHDFLGVERLFGRVRCTSRKIGDGALTNVRIIRADILHAMQHLLPPDSVDVLHLMFPDPWPKRRHQNRRAVSEEFLHAAKRALKAEGALQIATDDVEYFAQMERTIARLPEFVMTSGPGATAALVASTFEERFRACGAEIHRIVLRKTCAPRYGVASQRSRKNRTVTAPV